MLTIGVLLVLAAAAIAAGVATRRRRRAALIGGAISLLLILVRVVFVRFRVFEAAVVPWDLYPYVEHFWVIPFGAFIVGVAEAHMTTKWLRPIVIGCAGAAVGWVFMTAVQIARTDTDELTGVVVDRTCRQSSPWSCGAAAAATWLESYGVEAGEREMAVLCVSDQHYGTSPIGMLRGLRRRMPDTALRVEMLDRPPERAAGPWVVVVDYMGLVQHWVVIDAIDPDGADVRDPLFGPVRWDREELEERWEKIVVLADE